jgi:AbrB family looped-hinge helix DNA binding protein
MRQRKRIRIPSKRAGFSEDAAAANEAAAKSPVPTQQTVELGAGGRLVIPAPMRAALGMKVGDRLTVRLEGDQLSLYTYQAGIRRAQERLRPYLPENAVDEFLRWKREEAAREEAKFAKFDDDMTDE